MFENRPITLSPRLAIILLWLGWWLILNVFQVMAFARVDLNRPDTSYAWTARRTQDTPPASNPVKLHVRWDSGFYVSIALYGYDGTSAAFFPLYPLAMRVVNGLLNPLLPDLNTLDRMELAGFIVSSLASLIAALGMYELLMLVLGADDARRGVFYFLIYPPAIFLLQVYSEPLFLSLATWCLAFMVRRRWWVAGVLAGIATLDRATGVLLVIPLFSTWLLDWYHSRRPAWHTLGILIIPPVVWRMYFAWLHANGLSAVKGQAAFGRSFLPGRPLALFVGELGYVLNNPQATVHITLDILLTLIALIACVYMLRRQPAIALFGLATMMLPLLTFRVVGLNRYTLACIPIFLALASFGRSRLFDRLWTVASLLVFGLYILLFSHAFWVG